MMSRTVMTLRKAGRHGTTRADTLLVFLVYFKAFIKTPTEIKHLILIHSVWFVTGIAHTFVSLQFNLILTTAP